MTTKKYMSSVLKTKLRMIFFSRLSVTNSWVLYSPIFRQKFRKTMEEKMLDLWAYLEPNDIFLLISFESCPHFPILFWSLNPHSPLISWNLPPLSEPLEWFSSPNSFQSMPTVYPLLLGPLIKLASSTCTVRHTQDYTSDSILNYKQSIA